MKAIIFFILGLLGWLLITNYQVVYSKVISFTNPNQETTEIVAETEPVIVATSAAKPETDNSAKILSPDSNTSSENELSTSDTQLTENIKDSKDEIASDSVNSSNLDEIAEETEEKSDTDITATESNDADIELDNKSDTESEIKPESDIKSTQKTNIADSNTASAAESSSNPGMQQPQQSNIGMPMYNQNMMNPGIMNPGMFMNPMAMMTPMMMGMMSPMMNPAMMMNPNAMLNHPVNTMTHPQNMNAMMMSMNPNMMFSMFGQPSKEYQDGEVPEQLPVITIPGMPTQTFQNWSANKVSPGVSREAKKHAFQTAMAMSPLSMRDMMGIMADKMPVNEDVSWDDAIEAMKLRANEVNFKFVGSSKLWKEIEAVTGKPSAKVEMFRFCDAAVARRILDVVPEFIVFLPCKIALMEDGEGKLWVMTMDWDINWLDYSQNPNSHLAKNIRDDAHKIRENMRYIMEGAATGEF